MSYLSFRFAALFLMTLFLFYVLPKRLRWGILLGASLLFYISFDARCMVHLLFVSGTTFLAAKAIERRRHTKRWLFLGIAVNAALWFAVKDLTWFANGILQHVGFEGEFAPPAFLMLVPVGISYYTLQATAYLVDVYRGKIRSERSFFKYLLYLSYFPAIVQGPISRYSELSEQFIHRRPFCFEQFLNGMTLVLWGAIKKMVVADRLALIANHCFGRFADLHGFVLYFGAVAYAFQLYMDFSGCVDICRGVSHTFGIELSQNFDSPYFAKSIKEFWNRWHLTLSRWLRDYIYIPLGGNRKGALRKYVNLTATFVFSGLWHGAGTHYIAWGLLQAIYQVFGSLTQGMREKAKRAIGVEKGSCSEKIYATVITFHLTLLSWILFRCERVSDAIHYVKNMLSGFHAFSLFHVSWYPQGITPIVVALLTLHIAIILITERKVGSPDAVCRSVRGLHLFLRWSVYVLLIFDILLFGVYGSGYNAGAFLYGGF